MQNAPVFPSLFNALSNYFENVDSEIKMKASADEMDKIFTKSFEKLYKLDAIETRLKNLKRMYRFRR